MLRLALHVYGWTSQHAMGTIPYLLQVSEVESALKTGKEEEEKVEAELMAVREEHESVTGTLGKKVEELKRTVEEQEVSDSPDTMSQGTMQHVH